ncbi:MAG: response regulator [Ignavibacteria bacterium]|jgi:CheY-like chemotaxis protein
MSKSILIVEDDPFTQKFYEHLFARKGYKLIQTENGNEIFEILENNQVSLLILDINLKNTYLDKEKLDGISISRKIKTNPKYSDLPVLLISAYNKKTGGRNFLNESLADDYFVKPITNFNSLIQKINTLIN